jgi:hypothetical protein
MNIDLSDDPIHDWVNQPIPEKLWHYTSVQGFQGIIGSGNIYATDVRFLNDSEEFIHARKVADDLVRETPELGDLYFPLRNTLEWALELIFGSDFLDPNSAQIFVASFSDSEDDLSQWRGYSHGTYGISIAFDLRMFRPPAESDSAVTLAPCVYDDDEKKNLIRRALQYFVKESQIKWTDVIQEFLRKHRSGETKPELDQIMNLTNAAFSGQEYQTQLKTGLVEARKRIIRLAGLLKHRAFHHEKEWRLVLPISPNKDKTNLAHPMRFRSTNGSLIPHIEFPLGVTTIPQSTGASPTFVLPINDVLLGPGTSDGAKSAAQAFLESRSVKLIPRHSDVPYRQA